MNVLKTSVSDACFDEKARIVSLSNRQSHTELIRSAGDEAWKAEIHDPAGNPIDVRASEQEYTVSATDHNITWTCSRLSYGDSFLPVRLTLKVAVEEDSFTFTATIESLGEMLIESFEYPVVSGAGFGNGSGGVLHWPRGCGERIPNPEKEKEPLSLVYPGHGSMQWFVYGTAEESLYFASHDPGLERTLMNVYPAGESVSFSYVKYPFVAGGGSWSSAPFVLRFAEGDWHECARRYRCWADTWFRKDEPPEWVKDCQGWFLVILKQQNGDVMWRYKDLPDMLDFSGKSGIGMVAAFGWGIGGHDHLYPDYGTAPDLGTREELEEAIRKVKARGGRVILYVNGQLIDSTGEYYQDTGRKISAKNRDGSEHIEFWHKFGNHSGYKHVVACQSTPEWRAKLLELAQYVEGLGADGIIFDQIGAASRSRMCFDRTHPHSTPANAMGPAVVRNMKEVQDLLAQKNPEFCIITEHPGDVTCRHIDLIHGSGFGACESPTAFPAMFRYTFPEYLMTNREHAGPAPFLSYRQANFAFLHGMRFDLECRYVPDTALLRKGIRPKREDYAHITSPPDMETMVEGPLEEYRDYLQELIRLREAHPELLRGVFRDDVGITLSNPGVTAKRFDLGSRSAIVLWNSGGAGEETEVSLRGYDLEEVAFPGGDGMPPSGPGNTGIRIPAEGLALLFFRKTL